MQRSGLAPAEAQELDKVIAQRVDILAEAASQTGVAGRGGALGSTLGSDLLAGDVVGGVPDRRGAYAGAGGGAAFMLEALGARTYPVGDATVASRLGPSLSHAELAVYVCGPIGADLPSGLLALLREAGGRIPVVLAYDHGGIAKGELKALGIAGAYELRPELAFMPAGGELITPEEMRRLLAERTQAIARTWGY